MFFAVPVISLLLSVSSNDQAGFRWNWQYQWPPLIMEGLLFGTRGCHAHVHTVDMPELPCQPGMMTAYSYDVETSLLTNLVSNFTCCFFLEYGKSPRKGGSGDRVHSKSIPSLFRPGCGKVWCIHLWAEMFPPQNALGQEYKSWPLVSYKHTNTDTPRKNLITILPEVQGAAKNTEHFDLLRNTEKREHRKAREGKKNRQEPDIRINCCQEGSPKA